jgi:hypothetical protein
MPFRCQKNDSLPEAESGPLFAYLMAEAQRHVEIMTVALAPSIKKGQ